MEQVQNVHRNNCVTYTLVQCCAVSVLCSFSFSANQYRPIIIKYKKKGKINKKGKNEEKYIVFRLPSPDIIVASNKTRNNIKNV